MVWVVSGVLYDIYERPNKDGNMRMCARVYLLKLLNGSIPS